MVSDKNDITPEEHPGPCHTHRTKPSRKNIYGSHPLIVKLKTLYTKPTSHAMNEPMARTFI